MFLFQSEFKKIYGKFQLHQRIFAEQPPKRRTASVPVLFIQNTQRSVINFPLFQKTDRQKRKVTVNSPQMTDMPLQFLFRKVGVHSQNGAATSDGALLYQIDAALANGSKEPLINSAAHLAQV